MKSGDIIKEINSIVTEIENIINPLQAAIATLKLAQTNLHSDPDGVKTLAAAKEARALIHLTLKKSGK